MSGILASVPALRNLALLVLCLMLPACGQRNADAVAPEARLIAPLIDPAKLATLGERGANPRVRKCVAFLWQAKQAGRDPQVVADQAVARIGWAGTDKGRLTATAMVRNLTIVERLGATTEADLEAMRRGRAPTVRKGPYAGEILSVDHMIPRSVAPELDNVIANLELMPLGLNQKKSNGVTDRQVDLARKLHAAGLLSENGLRAVELAR